MKNLYIIAGCNGAGKTTASFTVLPEMLNCDEFINADEIARGISPFKPEKAAIEAGKLMLSKINKLIKSGKDFAVETTLATKSYIRIIDSAHKHNYEIGLLFFWLQSSDLAIERVKSRVLEGGHNIHTETIVRRYYKGIYNFFNVYLTRCDFWILLNSSSLQVKLVAEGRMGTEEKIYDSRILKRIKEMSKI